MADFDNNDCKVYVGSLKFETTKEGLEDHFSSVGEVLNAEVILDRETGRSRGFGFVTFRDSSTAKKACDTLNETEFDGRTIKVSRANSRSSGRGRGGGGHASRGFGGGRRSGGYGGGGFGGGGGGGGYENYGGGSYGGNYSSSGGGQYHYGAGGGSSYY